MSATVVTIASLDLTSIEEKIKTWKTTVEEQETLRTKLRGEIREVEKRLVPVEEKIKLYDKRLENLRDLKVMVTVLHDKKYHVVRALRYRILTLEGEVKKDTITVARQRKIYENLETEKKQLTERCDHPIVFYENGHDTLDDGYYCGSRECVVCGLSVRSNLVNSSETYDRTVMDDNRLVTQSPYVPHPGKYSIWKPLDQVLTECIGDLSMLL